MVFVKKIETEEGLIGIWEITGEADNLISKFCFSDNEKREFEKISFERRKKEFIAVRLILEKLLNKKTEIFYDISGRPLLKDSDLNLSISHSKDLVVVFLSKQKIGIDVENVERKIENIARRFLNQSEMDFVQTCADRQKAMILMWCAKEAIFKCSEKQGIHFNREIEVFPFSLDNEKFFGAKKSQTEKKVSFRLQHFEYKNNVVVFCVEDVEKS